MTLSEAAASPEAIVTTGLLLGGAFITAGLVILEKKPKTELKVRLLPTTPLMIASGLVTLWALMHLATVLGFHR